MKAGDATSATTRNRLRRSGSSAGSRTQTFMLPNRIPPSRNTTCSKCCLILPARCTWATCATVLANEQVVGGCCWRHEDTLVEQRELEQWFLRTTKYADELLRDLDRLPGWPEKVRTMQRNWIGRSEGAQVDFRLDTANGEVITVFTTRVDTIYGATSVQLAPEHPITEELAALDPELGRKVEQLIAEQKKAKESGDLGE